MITCSVLIEFLLSVPKVSIDGESHGDLLLIAIGTGTTFAVVILVVLTSLIRHKNKPTKSDENKLHFDNFTLAPSPSDSGLSESATQKSNLMFRYFGKSLSSFDLEKSSSLEMRSTRSGSDSGSIAINIDHRDRNQLYRQNILSVSDVISYDNEDKSKPKYIQTVAC